MRHFLFLLACALPAQAQDASSITVLERRNARIEAGPASPTQALGLTLVHFKDGGWQPDAILAAVHQGARLRNTATANGLLGPR